MNRYSEEYKKLGNQERRMFLKENFHTNPAGKYFVETKCKTLSGNGFRWLELIEHFDDIEDAKKFIRFYCVPNMYGTCEPGRVVHREWIDDHTVKTVVDWEA